MRPDYGGFRFEKAGSDGQKAHECGIKAKQRFGIEIRFQKYVFGILNEEKISSPVTPMPHQDQARANAGPIATSATASPASARMHPILQLQKTIGNQQVQSLLQRGLLGNTNVFFRAPDPKQQAKKTQECLAQKDEILPGIGVVGSIGREETLLETLGAEYDPLKKQIQASMDARKFVCEAGVPAVLALWDTRTATGQLSVPSARAALAGDSAKVYSENLDTSWLRHRRISRAENELTDVGVWVAAEARTTHLPNVLVRPLPAPQRENVLGAAQELEALAPVFENATTEFSTADKTAFDLRQKLEEARVEAIKAQNPDYAGGPREPLQKALEIATKLRQQLDVVHAGIDVGSLKNGSADILGLVRKLNESPSTVGSDAIRSVRDHAEALRKKISAGSTNQLGLAGAARRVAFALRYFAALNTPGFAGAPDKNLMSKLGPLDFLSSDISLIFGGQAPAVLDFLSEVGGKIHSQIDSRTSMEAASGQESKLEPEKADVLSYFHALQKKGNGEVIKAYETYAQGFFEHRIAIRPDDLDVKGLDEIFSRPISMAGARPLVCSGFAVLGADLLAAAGGKIVEFKVAIRASADQLRTNQWDDAHAIAIISRKGETLYVTNDLVVRDQNQAIGPDAVAWQHKNFPLITATGKTWQEANAALGRELAKH